jgi:hypothetical protein
MNTQILTGEQKEILPLIQRFNTQFGLVGGTAVALYLGHRRSIDFDLFTQTDFDIQKIKNNIKRTHLIDHIFSQGDGELTVLVNKVKITFFQFPYNIEFVNNCEDVINLPDLLTLGAMKAFALGKRAKWKDYVDLYFITKEFSFNQVILTAEKIFANEFNEKLFRAQLSYFKDIDYSEEVIYLPTFSVDDLEVQNYLEKISLQN